MYKYKIKMCSGHITEVEFTLPIITYVFFRTKFICALYCNMLLQTFRGTP